MISSAAEFNEYQSVAYDFNVTGQEYVGLRFMNEDTGILNYGWALMSTTYNTSPNRGFDAFVLAYGYEDTGLSITAGETDAAVPEPDSLALLGLALAGMTVLRRRKM